MKEFLISNWYYLALLLLGLCNMLILLLKKNKIVQSDTIFEQLLLRLPTMIRTVEEKKVSGSEKKALVMTYALTWLSSMTGKDASIYSDKVSEAIEEILTTPTKKGV